MTVDWIRKALAETGKTRSGLAKALGRSPSAVTDLLNGSRRLRAEEIAIAVEYLGVEPPRLVGGGAASSRIAKAQLIGAVEAGAAVKFFDAESAASPAAPNGEAVALEIRGDCLGALFDGWQVVYDNLRAAPADDAAGRLCVCGLVDGRVLVRIIRRSQSAGLWNLFGNLEPSIADVALDWAGVVRELRQR